MLQHSKSYVPVCMGGDSSPLKTPSMMLGARAVMQQSHRLLCQTVTQNPIRSWRMMFSRPGSQHTLAESVTLRGARHGDRPAPVPDAAAALDASLLAEGAATAFVATAPGSHVQLTHPTIELSHPTALGRRCFGQSAIQLTTTSIVVRIWVCH